MTPYPSFNDFQVSVSQVVECIKTGRAEGDILAHISRHKELFTQAIWIIFGFLADRFIGPPQPDVIGNQAIAAVMRPLVDEYQLENQVVGEVGSALAWIQIVIWLLQMIR